LQKKSPFNKGAVSEADWGFLERSPNIYLPYNKNLFHKARKLRNNTTLEENKLWYQYLAKSPIRFLRQKPIDNYILDFYCPKKKIAIEIDGSQHYTEEGLEYDKIRTDILNQYKITVIRFTNFQIKYNFKEVCEHIEDTINHIENKKQIL